MSCWSYWSRISNACFSSTEENDNFFLKKRKSRNTRLGFGVPINFGNYKSIAKTPSCFSFRTTCRKAAKSTRIGNLNKAFLSKLSQDGVYDGNLSSSV